MLQRMLQAILFDLQPVPPSLGNSMQHGLQHAGRSDIFYEKALMGLRAKVDVYGVVKRFIRKVNNG